MNKHMNTPVSTMLENMSNGERKRIAYLKTALENDGYTTVPMTDDDAFIIAKMWNDEEADRIRMGIKFKDRYGLRRTMIFGRIPAWETFIIV